MTRNILSVHMNVVLVVLAVAGVGLGRLESRAFTAPSCNPPASFTWMDSEEHKDPCITAAYLQGACHGPAFAVSPLQTDPLNGTHYSPGDAKTADRCYCSWATYNLLMACTFCQGSQNGILSWSEWNSTSCATLTSTTTPWPLQDNNTISDGVRFPRWAATDPRNWTEERWNSAQASAIASTALGDYPLATSTTTETAKSGGGSNAGAIAGGVVGGVVAIAAGVAIAIFLLCRRRRRRFEQEKNSDLDMIQHPVVYHHGHSTSDVVSNRVYPSHSGYTPLGHVSSPSNGSTFLQSPSTFLTHANSDVQSLAQESLLHAIGVAPSPTPQGSSTLFTPPLPQPQGAVSPFTGQQPSSDQSLAHDRKRSEASQEIGSSSTEIASRTPLNPPAYSEAPGDRGDFSSRHPDQLSTIGSSSIITTPSSSAQQSRHEKSSSGTSMFSSGSHLTHPSNLGYWNQPGGSTSFGGVADILNTSDTPQTGPTPTYVPPPPGTIMSVQRSEKPRLTTATTDTAPTEGNNGDR